MLMPDNKKVHEDTGFWQLLPLPLAEWMLTVLPLLVLIIVELLLGKGWQEIVASPEWSFGASVLFGLAVFKLVIGVVKGRADEWENIGLTVVLLIVVGLVPSLIVLALRLSMASSEPPRGLVVTQCLLFLLASVTFLVFGAVAHYGLFHRSRSDNKPSASTG